VASCRVSRAKPSKLSGMFALPRLDGVILGGQMASASSSSRPRRRSNQPVALDAATHDDPIVGRVLYLREVTRLRGRAETAQSWTAVASLLRLERELIDEIRTARLGAAAVLDEAGLEAALVEALRGLPQEQRRTVLTLVG